jgi:hypothetical protein
MTPGTWDDIPDCPFITDLHTAPALRGHGTRPRAAHTVPDPGEPNRPARLALRVDSANTAALRLCDSPGFRPHH